MHSPTPLIMHTETIEARLPGIDPFIFGAYHLDHYPASNGELGLADSVLEGRDPSADFSGRDGFSLYHNHPVPGFPAHPHRGFETVTIVRQGVVDHADSLGATARYGQGDVQWLTTGRGIQHGEMFPLLHQDRDNPLDLIQIWVNLPAKKKMVEPEFKIYWAENIPCALYCDDAGAIAEVLIVAGDYRDQASANSTDAVSYSALPPPQNSWAADPASDVAIWVIRLAPGAAITLPPANSPLARRAVYLLRGAGLVIDEQQFDQRVMLEVAAVQALPIKNNGAEKIELLLLQGRPIGEPVVARGPFVVNTQQELIQTIDDYQRTEFGGWPWPTRWHTHGQSGRFAQYPDGRTEKPSQP